MFSDFRMTMIIKFSWSNIIHLSVENFPNYLHFSGNQRKVRKMSQIWILIQRNQEIEKSRNQEIKFSSIQFQNVSLNLNELIWYGEVKMRGMIWNFRFRYNNWSKISDRPEFRVETMSQLKISHHYLLNLYEPFRDGANIMGMRGENFHDGFFSPMLDECWDNIWDNVSNIQMRDANL